MATTTALPWPLTTLVPMKQIFGVSSGPIPPRAVAMADFSATLPRASYFSTGMDSPVRIAWLTNRSFDDNSRTSAGIMSPAPRWTMSPGTSSAIGISRRVDRAGSLSHRITAPVAGLSADFGGDRLTGAVNLNGYADAGPYRFTGLGRLIAGLLTELGHDQADVLGISWGGAVAQHFAAFQSARCRR